MLNQDIALDFSYTVFGAILRKNLPTFLKINMPGVVSFSTAVIPPPLTLLTYLRFLRDVVA